MEAQGALTVAFSSSAFFGLLFLIFLLTIPHIFSNAARPASERYGAVTHTGYSHVALAGDSNDQAAMSITEHVENYSKNLTLVTPHKSGGTPFNHLVSTAWCSL